MHFKKQIVELTMSSMEVKKNTKQQCQCDPVNTTHTLYKFNSFNHKDWYYALSNDATYQKSWSWKFTWNWPIDSKTAPDKHSSLRNFKFLKDWINKDCIRWSISSEIHNTRRVLLARGYAGVVNSWSEVGRISILISCKLINFDETSVRNISGLTSMKQSK